MVKNWQTISSAPSSSRRISFKDFSRRRSRTRYKYAVDETTQLINKKLNLWDQVGFLILKFCTSQNYSHIDFNCALFAS